MIICPIAALQLEASDHILVVPTQGLVGRYIGKIEYIAVGIIVVCYLVDGEAAIPVIIAFPSINQPVTVRSVFIMACPTTNRSRAVTHSLDITNRVIAVFLSVVPQGTSSVHREI